jgi:uncharacterized protein YjlB
MTKPTAEVTPLASLKVTTHQIPAHGLIPNTSILNKPLLIYHSCFPSTTTASIIESHLKSIGVVTPQWRYSMFPTTHFHTTTHEVLSISHGSATVLFGGEGNEGNVETLVKKGDVIFIPAGVGHRLIKEGDEGFEMVGAYPNGFEWDMCYGKKGEERRSRELAIWNGSKRILFMVTRDPFWMFKFCWKVYMA